MLTQQTGRCMHASLISQHSAELNRYPLSWLVTAVQARDVERRKEQERGVAILQQQLVERQAQRVREEELRDQVCAS